MFDFLKSKRSVNQAAPAPVSVSAVASNLGSDVRRELIRVVLKDTLRQHGIPLDWIACEVILIPRALDKEELHIHLVLMKWNEQVLRYAAALQQQLLLGLDRFDPEIDHSGYIVSWRFGAECRSPFLFMPEPKFWIQSAPSRIPETPVSVLDRRHTRRPAKAPAVMPMTAMQNSTSDHYAPTQIAPLS